MKEVEGSLGTFSTLTCICSIKQVSLKPYQTCRNKAVEVCQTRGSNELNYRSQEQSLLEALFEEMVAVVQQKLY